MLYGNYILEVNSKDLFDDDYYIDYKNFPIDKTNFTRTILVEPENSDQLADAILKLLKNDLLLEKLGNSGFEHVLNVANSKKMAENNQNKAKKTAEKWIKNMDKERLKTSKFW
mgnify:CR=1 FL=1